MAFEIADIQDVAHYIEGDYLMDIINEGKGIALRDKKSYNVLHSFPHILYARSINEVPIRHDD